jgi:poly(A) polymerase
MADLTPHAPRNRPLFWSDTVMNLQEALLELELPPLYISGGAVRDAYLHRPIKDVDLTTPIGNGIKVARQIANLLNGDVFVMDQERDVARVFAQTPDGKLTLDVAGFRGADLLADLQGRDFTINAIAVDLLGDLNQLIDPLNGEQDADQKLIRRCTPDSIATDPIRGLRAVRQSVQLTMHIEAETLKDIRTHAHRLMETSPERVRDEVFNLLNLDRVGAALRVADTVGLLAHIFPELAPLHGLPQPPPHVFEVWQHTLMTIEKLAQILLAISYRRTDATAAVFDMGMMAMQFDRYRRSWNAIIDATYANDRPHRAVLIMAALLHNAGKGVSPNYNEQSVKMADERAEALRLSNPEKKRLLTAIQQYRRVLDTPEFTPLEQHRFWHQLGEAGHDVILLALADYLGTVGNEIVQDDWLALVGRARTLLSAYHDLHEAIVKPPTLLNGNDLMTRLNLPASPIIGKLLDRIREAQVTGEVTTMDDALALARQVVDETR